MKHTLVIERDELRKALKVAKLPGWNPYHAKITPVRLSAEGMYVQLSADNRDASMSTLALSDTGEGLDVVIPHEALSAAIEAAEPGAVKLALTDDDKLVITTKRSVSHLNTLPIKDYPQRPLMPKDAESIDVKDAWPGIVAVAGARDFESDEGWTLALILRDKWVFATDRYRVARYPLPVDVGPKGMCIPSYVIGEVVRSKVPIDYIRYGGSQFVIGTMNGTSWWSTFQPVEELPQASIMDRFFSHKGVEITFDRKEMIDALSKVSKLPGESMAIVLDVCSDTVTVSRKDKFSGSVAITVDAKANADIKLAFGPFLQKALEMTSVEQVAMFGNGIMSPWQLREGLLEIAVMPMRVN